MMPRITVMHCSLGENQPLLRLERGIFRSASMYMDLAPGSDSEVEFS